MLHHSVTRVVELLRRRPGLRHRHDQRGMSTAELLANAALGVGALVLVWGLMRTLGVDMLSWMRTQIGIG